MDPEELFRKSEPHNRKKQDSRRWRLISNVSLVDTLTQLTIHKAQNVSVIRSFQMNPSEATCVAGLGHDDLGVQAMGRVFDRILAEKAQRKTRTGITSQVELMDSDAEAWDWNVNRSGFLASAYRRVYQEYHEYGLQAIDRDDDDEDPPLEFEWTWELFMCEAITSSAHIFVIGKDLVEPLEFGIMSTGSGSTTGDNSDIREVGARMSGAVDLAVVGDELFMLSCLSQEKSDEMFRRVGVVPKFLKVVEDGEPIEFASHLYSRLEDGTWYARFLNVDKLLAGLDLNRQFDKKAGVKKPPDPDAIAGRRFCLRNTPEDLDFFDAVLRKCGWDVPDMQYDPDISCEC
jgi:hypothetical protein